VKGSWFVAPASLLRVARSKALTSPVAVANSGRRNILCISLSRASFLVESLPGCTSIFQEAAWTAPLAATSTVKASAAPVPPNLRFMVSVT
jgi:hypothetical protein